LTKLQQLHRDNLTRAYLRDGTLRRMVADGIRGVTANPTIFARAIEGSDDYDEQFGALIRAGRTLSDSSTLPESTIAAFEDHGRVARTIDADTEHAHGVLRGLASVGIDMDAIGLDLEDQGVAAFHQSLEHVLRTLDVKSRQLVIR
jgi:transaldolase